MLTFYLAGSTYCFCPVCPLPDLPNKLIIVLKVKNLFQKFYNKFFTGSPVKTFNRKVTPSTFYLLECWNQYGDLPETILPYVDKIKRKEEWEALGFLLEQNRLGQIRKLKVSNRYFSFIPVSPSHGIETEAIRTGKRLTQNPGHIQLLLDQGCKPEEFLHFPATLNISLKAKGVLQT
jgi:hypothetical protein